MFGVDLQKNMGVGDEPRLHEVDYVLAQKIDNHEDLSMVAWTVHLACLCLHHILGSHSATFLKGVGLET